MVLNTIEHILIITDHFLLNMATFGACLLSMVSASSVSLLKRVTRAVELSIYCIFAVTCLP